MSSKTSIHTGRPENLQHEVCIHMSWFAISIQTYIRPMPHPTPNTHLCMYNAAIPLRMEQGWSSAACKGLGQRE